MKIWTARIGWAGAIAAAAIAGLAFSISASQPDATHLVLRQQPPDLHAIPLKEGDWSIGDLVLFDAAFAAEDGSSSGILTGSLLVVDLGNPEGDPSDSMQSRLTNLVFNVEDRGTIVVAGSAVYPGLELEIAPDAPQVRAIVGGTGDFIGATGEVSTTRETDGSYTHDLTLLNDD